MQKFYFENDTHFIYDKQSRMFIKDGLSSLILAGNMTQEGREVRGNRVVRSEGITARES